MTQNIYQIVEELQDTPSHQLEHTEQAKQAFAVITDGEPEAFFRTRTQALAFCTFRPHSWVTRIDTSAAVDLYIPTYHTTI